MFATCPKCKYQRQPTDAGDAGLCPSCGLVFAKWVQRQIGAEVTRARTRPEVPDTDTRVTLRAWLTTVDACVDAVAFWGRVAIYIVFFIWGWYFILLDFRGGEIGESFMHRVNLVFHEAGHVIFMAFGNFMMVLGGTLGQLLMPLIIMTALIVKNRDNFGGSIGLWWFGQSLMDCAPYINDARDLQLMLLGGGTGADRPGMHDWENILTSLGLLQHERRIAWMADTLGSLTVMLALAWGGYILYLQYRHLKHETH
jgi:hypothetical protein